MRQDPHAPNKRSKMPPNQGAPFPDVYKLIHTSPAFRTKCGNIRPAVLTYAIKGQGNRRVRLTRPWKKNDPPLDRPQITIGEAERLTQNGLKRLLQKREKRTRFQENLRGVELRVDGPTSTFFKE